MENKSLSEKVWHKLHRIDRTQEEKAKRRAELENQLLLIMAELEYPEIDPEAVKVYASPIVSQFMQVATVREPRSSDDSLFSVRSIEIKNYVSSVYFGYDPESDTLYVRSAHHGERGQTR